MRASRTVGVTTAALVAAGGYVHLCLYRHGYRAIPKIGDGFLLQIIASAAVAVALLLGPLLVSLARAIHITEGATATAMHVAALALAAGTLVAFALTRTPSGLFNFRERGLEPAPQALIALVAETAVVVICGAQLLGAHLQSHRIGAHVQQV